MHGLREKQRRNEEKMQKSGKILLIIFSVLTAGLWCFALLSRQDGKEAVYGEIIIRETPDREESAEHPLFIKEVYEPVIPEGVNIAEDAKIEANGYNDVYTPRKVKDGNPNGQSYWEGASDDYPNILTATFEEGQSIHAVKLLLCPLSVWSARTQTFSVEISEDGETFNEFLASTDYEFNPDRGNEVVLEFDDITIRAIRFAFTGNTGASGAQVAELEIYSR